MNEKPITTLGPWSYHNPIDMAADEQSFSVNKEVKWMNKIDKRIEKIEKGTPVYDCQGIIVCYIENDADKAWLIDSYKKCREKNTELNRLFDLQQTRMNEAVAMWRKATGKEDTIPDLGDLLEWLMGVIKQETGTLTPNLNRYLSKRDIERHAKEACKKALYSKIKRAPGTKFPYVPWRDIEQAIDEAKIE